MHISDEIEIQLALQNAISANLYYLEFKHKITENNVKFLSEDDKIIANKFNEWFKYMKDKGILKIKYFAKDYMIHEKIIANSKISVYSNIYLCFYKDNITFWMNEKKMDNNGQRTVFFKEYPCDNKEMVNLVEENNIEDYKKVLKDGIELAKCMKLNEAMEDFKSVYNLLDFNITENTIQQYSDKMLKAFYKIDFMVSILGNWNRKIENIAKEMNLDDKYNCFTNKLKIENMKLLMFVLNKIVDNSQENKVTSKLIMTRDELAIEVSKLLYNLSVELEETKKGKVFFSPSVKDENIIRNCTPFTIDELKNTIRERTTIKKFVLSTSLVQGNDLEEEYNDKSKITVEIFNNDKILLKYQNEIGDNHFDITYEKIKELLKHNSDREVVEEKVNRAKPIREMCDFGILGTYPLNRINVNSEKYSEKQGHDLIKKIMKKYKENIEDINKRIFTEIYNKDFVGSTAGEVWNEKVDLNNIKENIKIYNVNFDVENNIISIEFNFMNGFLMPMIELNYKNNFEIVSYS